MTMNITFELNEDDLKHFSRVMEEANERLGEMDEAGIVAATHKLMDEVRAAQPPEFISSRMDKIKVMADMVPDAGWDLPDDDKRRVLGALAYFCDPEDLIPDNLPGLGFLDDAIMAELIVRDMKHEIEAYQDFCKFRAAEASRRGIKPEECMGKAEWMESRRKQLQSRMRRRRGKDRGGRTRSKSSAFSFF